jgi:F0F1-type ATP synthase delta subunit
MMQEVFRVAIPIIVIHVVVLALLVGVLRMMIVGHARRATTRVKQIEDEVRKKEEDIKREIEDHEKDFTVKKTEAERQLQEHRDEAKREASRLKEQSIAEAKKESTKIIEQAHKNEQKIKDQIARQMEEKTVEYGGRVFKLVFSDLMTGDLNKQFINELIDALDEIEKGSITVDEPAAEVISSHPLEADQKARLEAILRDKFNDDATITESTDEALLGGIILKMGSLEIDGSLRNRYQDAVNEVKKEAHVAA